MAPQADSHTWSTACEKKELAKNPLRTERQLACKKTLWIQDGAEHLLRVALKRNTLKGRGITWKSGSKS